MTVVTKSNAMGVPHIQTRGPSHSKAKRLGIAQKISDQRLGAKPPTIEKAPWEKDESDE